MHTTKAPNGTMFHHSGDFSGEIIITGYEDGTGNCCKQIPVTMRVDMDDILYLVGEKIRRKRIEELEQADIKDLIGGA